MNNKENTIIEAENVLNSIGNVNLQKAVINSVPMDSKEVGESLSGRREPDTLPVGSFQELPEVFKFLDTKLDASPQLVKKIILLLKAVVKQLEEQSREYELFTQAVPIPKKLDVELLNILGIPADSLRKAGDQIGFSLKHRMYSEPYYLIFSYLFYYGCKTENIYLRQLSLIMMLVRLYRGRISRMWKRGSDSTTTQFVMEKRLRSTSLAKRYPNTFDVIIIEWTPRLDEKYWRVVKNHPAHELRGMSSILTAAYARINQMYVGLSRHYYKAFNEGYKTGAYNGNEDMEENHKLSLVGKFTEKIYTSMVFINNPISDYDKNFIRLKTNTTFSFISAFEEFVKNQDNEQEIKELIELILTEFKFGTEQDIAHMNIEEKTNTISVTKSKDKPTAKIKQLIESILKYAYSNYNTWAESSKATVRKAFLMLFLLKIQQPFIKKSNYMEVIPKKIKN